jgi:hypothetical protein
VALSPVYPHIFHERQSQVTHSLRQAQGRQGNVKQYGTSFGIGTGIFIPVPYDKYQSMSSVRNGDPRRFDSDPDLSFIRKCKKIKQENIFVLQNS